MPTLRVIGPGRAGTAMSRALAATGWTVVAPVGHGEDVRSAAGDVDLLLIATPDAAVAEVAGAVEPVATTVVAHLAGSLGLDALAPHERRAGIHPIVSIPTPDTDVRGAWFAITGDDVAAKVVADLGGTAVHVDDGHRAAHHAAACIASNHLVALLGQVERVAATAGVPLEAYLALARQSLDNVGAVGPRAALTGPVKRGDAATIERHRAALASDEIGAYDAMVELAERLEMIEVHETIADLRAALEAARRSAKTVGLVPTMGALHAGHASLVARAATDCDVVVVTVFVNPLQFGPTEDLGAYPRSLAADIFLADENGATHVFAPSVEEMYGTGSMTTVSVTGPLTDVLEGASRPTHFDGVATVVAKLFAITGACTAYFGEKDFQQLAVVRRMASDLSLPVEVMGCPTVRDADGLALSSRNVYLELDERRVAPTLHRALGVGADCVRSGETDPAVVLDAMRATIAAEPRFDLDYVAVVDPATFATPDPLTGELRLLAAARLGKARLIDNLGVTASAARTD